MMPKVSPRLFRVLINLYPMFFATGGKLIELSEDWKAARVQLKLGLWTRNYVGTIFGGSQFSALDPFPMIQLLNIVGNDYVVWDKSGKIEFKKPGKGRLFADVVYTDDELKLVLAEIEKTGRIDFVKVLKWYDEEGDLVSIVEKTLYVATKEYYKNRPKSSHKSPA